MIEFQVKQKDKGPTTFDMSVKSLRIVFMGTPEFAVASLDALVTAGFNIVGVVTAADKPAGRGMKMQSTPVKEYAVSKQIPVLQPLKLKDPEFLESLKALQAELQVVVAFRMLPEVVWNMPPKGTINLHGSLLPQYRGAAPINWAVINGEKTTGVTTFKLQHAIDTGDILLQESFAIDENETAGEVHDKMKVIGAALLVKTIRGIEASTITEQAQQVVEVLHHAPKIFTETAKIDFNRPVEQVHNLVRGLSPFPGAFTIVNDRTLKLLRSEKLLEEVNIEPGTVKTDGKTYFRFACVGGWLDVKELQMEGKRKMLVGDFLRGYREKKSEENL